MCLICPPLCRRLPRLLPAVPQVPRRLLALALLGLVATLATAQRTNLPAAAVGASAPSMAPVGPAALPGAAAAAPGQPYGTAVATRFPPPARPCDLAALAPGAQVFSSNDALATALAEIVRTAPAGTRVRRLSPGRSQDGVAL